MVFNSYVSSVKHTVQPFLLQLNYDACIIPLSLMGVRFMKKKRDSFIIIALFHSICRYNLNTMKKSEVFSLNIWNLYWTLKSITMLWNSLLVSPRYDFLSTKRKVGYLSPESKLLTNELHVIHLRWNCVAFILSTFNDDVPSFTIMEPFIKLTPW